MKHPIFLVAEICGRFLFSFMKNLGTHILFLVGLEDDFFFPKMVYLFSYIYVSFTAGNWDGGLPKYQKLPSNPFERWPSVAPVAVH